MDRATLIESMTGLLKAAVDAQGEQHEMEVLSDSPLVGGDTVLSSLALVTYILDVEAMLDTDHGQQVTLVNEQALSRSQSPFRTVETLADYILELTGVQPQPAEGVEPERRVAQG